MINTWLERKRMTHRFILIFAVFNLVAGGCAKKVDEPFAIAIAASDLINVALPGWANRDEYFHSRISLPADSASSAAVEQEVDFGPGPVIRLSPDTVVLIVIGTPVGAGHAQQGVIGAYWFERREKNWYLASKAPQFVETGSSGDAGEVKLIEPADDLKVLAVEKEDCWGGLCGRWLNLYRISEHGMDKLLKEDESIQLATDTRAATDHCEDLIKRDVGTHVRVSKQEYSADIGCVAVSAEWYVQVRKDGRGPGDIVLNFSGKQTSAELVPIEQVPAPTSAPLAEASAAQTNTPPSDTPAEEFLVTVNGIREQLVYRYRNGKYDVLSGRNPAPGI